jgi:hypothetical protein
LLWKSKVCGLSPQGYAPWTPRVDRFEVRTHTVSRGPAIWATVLALAFINVGVATSIVALMQPGLFWPLWLGMLLIGLGVVALLAAVRLWQRYLNEVRQQPAEARRGY